MRKTKTIVITEQGGKENRDKGKRFLITEMPALQAEKWAARAFLALAHSGVQIPDDIKSGGMIGLAFTGLQMLQGVRFEEAEPLMDEMLACIQIIPDPTNPEFTRPLQVNIGDGDDIEEVSTLLLLRQEIFGLHTDFFLGVSR